MIRSEQVTSGRGIVNLKQQVIACIGGAVTSNARKEGDRQPRVRRISPASINDGAEMAGHLVCRTTSRYQQARASSACSAHTALLLLTAVTAGPTAHIFSPMQPQTRAIQ